MNSDRSASSLSNLEDIHYPSLSLAIPEPPRNSKSVSEWKSYGEQVNSICSQLRFDLEVAKGHVKSLFGKVQDLRKQNVDQVGKSCTVMNYVAFNCCV